MSESKMSESKMSEIEIKCVYLISKDHDCPEIIFEEENRRKLFLVSSRNQDYIKIVEYIKQDVNVTLFESKVLIPISRVLKIIMNNEI